MEMVTEYEGGGVGNASGMAAARVFKRGIVVCI